MAQGLLRPILLSVAVLGIVSPLLVQSLPQSAKDAMLGFYQTVTGQSTNVEKTLSLQEYVAVSMQTKPGDPIGYKCDQITKRCKSLLSDKSLAAKFGKGAVIDMDETQGGFASAMPGKTSRLTMFSAQQAEKEKPSNLIQFNSKTRTSLMDKKPRPFGLKNY